MANLTRDDVFKLAKLARLHITDDEAASFEDEINAILGYVDQLQSVNLDSLEPTTQVTGLTNVTRPDEPVNYGYEATDLLKNVPTVENNQIKVKRMVG